MGLFVRMEFSIRANGIFYSCEWNFLFVRLEFSIRANGIFYLCEWNFLFVRLKFLFVRREFSIRANGIFYSCDWNFYSCDWKFEQTSGRLDLFVRMVGTIRANEVHHSGHSYDRELFDLFAPKSTND
ncbi:hypothetical protein L1987_63895 [Smallanthus sonchifolius]|uniref:Uncharacterized protein n=1 Tax=Smallanthus sonchifolius TaxID=185202 RepID=A0ACB9CEK2_9ASTR|nr:hypothetical protein L1987_63895 [Smallanthus sonchifolius]